MLCEHSHNLEAYTSFSLREYKKSHNYLYRLYSNQIPYGEEKYEISKKVISLNLIYGNYKHKNPDLINRFPAKHKRTGEIIDDAETEIVLIRLDKLKNIPYTKDEERFIRWLRLLNAQSIEQLRQLAKGDKVMEYTINYVNRYLNGPLNHTFEDYVREVEFKAEENGAKKGLKLGKTEGRKLGKIESLNEIARNMLKDNVQVELIQKYTGLSLNEIQKLKSSM